MTNGEIVRAFEELPLPVRMRAAAKVLGVVNDRDCYGTVKVYSPRELLALADQWESGVGVQPNTWLYRVIGGLSGHWNRGRKGGK